MNKFLFAFVAVVAVTNCAAGYLPKPYGPGPQVVAGRAYQVQPDVSVSYLVPSPVYKPAPAYPARVSAYPALAPAPAPYLPAPLPAYAPRRAIDGQVLNLAGLALSLPRQGLPEIYDIPNLPSLPINYSRVRLPGAVYPSISQAGSSSAAAAAANVLGGSSLLAPAVAAAPGYAQPIISAPYAKPAPIY